MPSSTSNSESRRGEARVVPDLPWARLCLLSTLLYLFCLAGWEVAMRHLGLQTGDLDDGRAYWAAERRKVDDGPRDPVVIVGDSRILFDTDLASWSKLTGIRPIQLALPGANPQPFLHDLANDEHFAGLAVVGTSEFSYFDDDDALEAPAIDYAKTESPSQRVGNLVYKSLSRHFAFLDSNYTLFTLLERHRWPERAGVAGPYKDVWKVSESFDDRQTYLWEQLEHDQDLRQHARDVWLSIYPGDVVSPEVVDHAIARAREDVEKIRARGGDVVWVRPPSAGPILDIERKRYPRAQAWDRLMAATSSQGVYFDDYPAMQNLNIPDYSHIARSSAPAFTEAYVSVLVDRVDWLRRRTSLASGGSMKVTSK